MHYPMSGALFHHLVKPSKQLQRFLGMNIDDSLQAQGPTEVLKGAWEGGCGWGGSRGGWLQIYNELYTQRLQITFMIPFITAYCKA